MSPMTCCSLLIAASLAMGYGDMPGHGGVFGTPMFLRGQPVWVTPISRRSLRRSVNAPTRAPKLPVEDDVATTLT